ncbi:hypothetical protein F5Y18DRAFT_421794 [Xylariaceae sp. FL1019]|nr:hypothetical protein F5Y18DRAFT_421794 [Xylariaceae sp. FL1019]
MPHIQNPASGTYQMQSPARSLPGSNCVGSMGFANGTFGIEMPSSAPRYPLAPPQPPYEMTMHQPMNQRDTQQYKRLRVPSAAAVDDETQGHVKRPPNKWILYRASRHSRIASMYPGITNSQISTIAGQEWRALPDEEKRVWEDKAERLRADHKRKYPDYKYQPGLSKRKDAGSGPTKTQAQMSTGLQPNTGYSMEASNAAQNNNGPQISNDFHPTMSFNELHPTMSFSELQPTRISNELPPIMNSNGFRPMTYSTGVQPIPNSTGFHSTMNYDGFNPTTNSHGFNPTTNSHGFNPTTNSHGFNPTTNSHEFNPTTNSHEFNPTTNSHESNFNMDSNEFYSSMDSDALNSSTNGSEMDLDSDQAVDLRFDGELDLEADLGLDVSFDDHFEWHLEM